MMSAILKVKPQIDQNEARKMERSLFDRFKNVGKTVKKTLKDVVSGGLLGFAVGLAQNMLSPIEAVEDKIKAMLGKASEFKDMADDFNTTAGNMRQLELFGLMSGLKNENLKAMMMSFRSAIDETQAQMLRKEPLDEKQSIVKNFAGEKDLAEGFFKFIQALRQIEGPRRELIERQLFGGVQYGASKRFIDNAGVVHGPQGYVNPRVGQFTNAIEKLKDLDQRYDEGKFSQESREILNYGSNMNKGYIDKMLAYEARQKAKDQRQLQAYDDLSKAREAIDKLNGIMEKLTEGLTALVVKLGELVTWLQKQTWSRGFMKMIGVGP